MVNIKLESLPKSNDFVEVVECKGVGHPDTLCDTLCEKASQALNKYYLKNFGKTLHHNLDKALIVAGKANVEFGGGLIEEPVKVIIAGRAVTKVGNMAVPVPKIVKEAVGSYLRQFKEFKSYEIEVEIKGGAANLEKMGGFANDSSVGAAHFPFTILEDKVLKVSNHLNSDRFRRRFLGVGPDTKVLGIRMGDKIKLIVAIAFVSKYIRSMEDYMKVKQKIKKNLWERFNVMVELNAVDKHESINDIYLTVSGFSCENGDDGQCGRGNRLNGLITPQQVMSIEAAAGKWDYHPGKTYQVWAEDLARSLVKKAGLKRVNVILVSKIGNKLSEPEIVYVQSEGKVDMEKVENIIDGCFTVA
ncbi:hypothetical protein HOC80_05080 [archaeon]|jgi:S-adenosylmethionine synthetase|nr:hypothetical protein [archaeon]